ncbi:MAG: hydrogenase maturation protease [Candidatus Heimdallarchaeota archaeon]
MEHSSKGKKILVAGVGSRLRGDDGFGPRVIDLLSDCSLPENVELWDLGTAGLTVASDLRECDFIIFLDAIEGSGEPGTLYKREITVDDVSEEDVTDLVSLSLHEAGLEGLLKIAKALGTLPPKVILIGCDPKSLEPGFELSKEVAAAVKKAVSLVMEILNREENNMPY